MAEVTQTSPDEVTQISPNRDLARQVLLKLSSMGKDLVPIKEKLKDKSPEIKTLFFKRAAEKLQLGTPKPQVQSTYKGLSDIETEELKKEHFKLLDKPTAIPGISEDTAAAVVANTLDTYTLGASKYLYKAFGEQHSTEAYNKTLKELQAAHPAASIFGTILGFAMPGSLGAKAFNLAGKAGRVAAGAGRNLFKLRKVLKTGKGLKGALKALEAAGRAVPEAEAGFSAALKSLPGTALGSAAEFAAGAAGYTGARNLVSGKSPFNEGTKNDLMVGGALGAIGGAVVGAGRVGARTPAGIATVIFGKEVLKDMEKIITLGAKNITERVAQTRKYIYSRITDLSDKLQMNLAKQVDTSSTIVKNEVTGIMNQVRKEINDVGNHLYQQLEQKQTNALRAVQGAAKGIYNIYEGAKETVKKTSLKLYSEVGAGNKGNVVNGKSISDFIYSELNTLEDGLVTSKGATKVLNAKSAILQGSDRFIPINLFKLARQIDTGKPIEFQKLLNWKRLIQNEYAGYNKGAKSIQRVAARVADDIGNFLISKDQSGLLEMANKVHHTQRVAIDEFGALIGVNPISLEKKLSTLYKPGPGKETLQKSFAEGLSFDKEAQTQIAKNLNLAKEYAELQASEFKSAKAISAAMKNMFSGKAKLGGETESLRIAKLEKLIGTQNRYLERTRSLVKQHEELSSLLKGFNNVEQNAALREHIAAKGTPASKAALKRLISAQKNLKSVRSAFPSFPDKVREVLTKDPTNDVNRTILLITRMFPGSDVLFTEANIDRLASIYLEGNIQGLSTLTRAGGVSRWQLKLVYALNGLIRSPGVVAKLAEKGKMGSKAVNVISNVAREILDSQNPEWNNLPRMIIKTLADPNQD